MPLVRPKRGPRPQSVTGLITDGLVGDPNGSQQQRAYHKLQTLTSVKVVNPKFAFDTYMAVHLLWRHILDAGPFEQTVFFLTVYCVARQCSSRAEGVRTPIRFEGGSIALNTYLDLVNTHNPVSGFTLSEVISNLNLHPVYKDAGDDEFYNKGQHWWTTHCLKIGTALHDKAMLLLTALFFLSVRSECVLKYLIDTPDHLLTRFDEWVAMYRHVCLESTPMIGLKEDPRKKRNQHTTEQKTHTAGHLCNHPSIGLPFACCRGFRQHESGRRSKTNGSG